MRSHAAALRAEQRLDDHVAAQQLERLQGRVGVLADDGGRHAQAGRLQQGRGQVLVHANLDGPRRIEDADAGRLEPVQQVHAEDDVLQRPRRHGADQDAVERGKGEPGRVSAGAGAETDATTRRKSTAVDSWPSAAAARCRSRTCQPSPAESRAMRMTGFY